MNRFLQNISEVETTQSGTYNEKEQALLDNALRTIKSAPAFLDDTPALSVHELRTKAFRLVREHQIKLIMIDYLQLMNASGMLFSNRKEEVSVITRSLKALAKELNIPIIVFSQLTRSVENREGIEEDSDMICFIHRPEYYKVYQDDKGNDLRGMAEIIVAKNRNEKIGNTLLKFSGQLTRFENAT